MPHGPDPPDLAGAAERLRRWLDELTGGADEDLAAWHQAHAAHLIAAALDLEALAADAPADGAGSAP